jgi:hypothetical protein
MTKFIEVTDQYDTVLSININQIVSFEEERSGGAKIILTSLSGGDSIIKYTKQSYQVVKSLINRQVGG